MSDDESSEELETSESESSEELETSESESEVEEVAPPPPPVSKPAAAEPPAAGAKRARTATEMRASLTLMQKSVARFPAEATAEARRARWETVLADAQDAFGRECAEAVAAARAPPEFDVKFFCSAEHYNAAHPALRDGDAPHLNEAARFFGAKGFAAVASTDWQNRANVRLWLR